MIVATLGLLLAGLALQLLAYRHGGHTAISDLPRVFLHRGVGPGSLPYVDRPVEYPVLAGTLLYLAALVWPTPLGVFLVTALAAGALCLAITGILEHRFGPRAWRWALGAPVLLYAFQNWDVFAIAALVTGLLAYEAHRDAAAGAAFGLGAAVKLFPAVVLPPLIALRWAQGDRHGARRLAVGGGGAFLVVNVPFLAANPSGWWWPYAFQSRRNATWGTAWFSVLRFLQLPVHGTAGAHLANITSIVALVLSLSWLVYAASTRPIAPFNAAAAAVAIFLLCNKVYSPTYDLWLVVFFVMVPLPRRLWMTFCAVDLAVFTTVYGYFNGVDSSAFVRTVLPVLVLIRTVTLVRLITTAMRREPDPSPRPSLPEPSRSEAERQARMQS
jgi:uncharacterized membrane protein